ncbi:uncharacterized protein EI97DRAFT_370810 [Westerdykella ornata]|uniref:chitin synthase n=1 Tax=Westerdykella ornata TaxID=318751 RepID=A0A6A6JRV5_WESOR|nr:uncharacterized protein EI97DRAFT_370810 [Westerdykella ornata]KAF2279340.1 hypothetical protein EI97DRAFT_370810 [Westerdykella ornata]
MASSAFAGSAHHNQPSLPALPQHQQTDEHITAHLGSRFHQKLAVSSLGCQGIVSLNTYKDASQGPDGGKDGSAQQAVEDLAQRVYTRMGHRSEDQAVVFLGESGSGKTTLRGHLLKALLSHSATPLSKMIESANFIFDAFTTTNTTTSPTASKAGLMLELQYETANNYATLLGAQFIAHRHERSRIASVPTGERNYHIFYHMLSGLSPSEKAHLHLDSIASEAAGTRTSVGARKRWRYLGHPTMLKLAIDDRRGFEECKAAFRRLHFSSGDIGGICTVLAAILHLGQLEFETGQKTTPAADDSGGYSHEGGESVTLVKNRESLVALAAVLAVNMDELEQCFQYKTAHAGNTRYTVILDPRGARAKADELARALYSLLLAYVMERLNKELSQLPDQVVNTISVVDFPGFAYTSTTGSVLDQLLINSANEALFNFCQQSFFNRQIQEMEAEEIAIPEMEYFDNNNAKVGLLRSGNGLLAILDDQARREKTDHQFLEAIRKRFDGKNDAIVPGSLMVKQPGSNFATPNPSASFTIRHYAMDVDYPVEGLLEENRDIVSADMVALLQSSRNTCVNQLLGQEALNKVTHPKERTAIMEASVSSKPMRTPSVARRKPTTTGRAGRQRGPFEEDAMSDADSTVSGGKKGGGNRKGTGAAAQVVSALKILESALCKANAYFVFCLKPNDRRIANQFDTKCVRTQVQTMGIAEISKRLRVADVSVFLPYGQFLGLAAPEIDLVGSEKEKAEMVLRNKPWRDNEVRLGATGVFLSENRWLEIANIADIPPLPVGVSASEDNLLSPEAARSFTADPRRGLLDPSPYSDDKRRSYMDAPSEAASGGDMFQGVEKAELVSEKTGRKGLEKIDEQETKASRKRWLFLVYLLTWWIPDKFIEWFGRMKRQDVRTAWREKLAINMLIWLTCGFFIFLMIGFPAVICPTQHVYSPAELSHYDAKDGRPAYVAMRGIVYDLGKYIPAHYPSIVPRQQLERYAGKDATNLFPVQVSALCNGVGDSGIHPGVQLNYRTSNYTDQTNLISTTDKNARYHDFRWFYNDSRPDWWYEQQMFLKSNYMKGRVGYSPQYLKTLATKKNHAIAYMYGKVYDFTEYIPGGREVKEKLNGEPGPDMPADPDFMHKDVVEIFRVQAGNDISKYWEALKLDSKTRKSMQQCLDNLFYVGDVDTRSSARCLFAKYFLLSISILMCSVILAKFISALQFGKKNIPEDLDKFIICTVPAYTEDEESLRRAIDSAATMKYEDKRKLLVVICDGMIIGQGNDKPTPNIVLDILNPDGTADNAEPLSFESLGEGLKQHNMGKVYSGLYECQGHIVPYLVIVKVGKPSEVAKPGNRGKRDTQVLIMRFLSRVLYNLPMSPLELEMYHHIRNIIGVNPQFYEFLLQIDADTVVAPDSASRFVAAFRLDNRLIGVCGETALTNAKSSFVTMMQVYEYYISHNLTKAFESLFGSVTCLPGCFTMYRIREEGGKPLFVSKEVVQEYSRIRVDTLHMKNLLHLGEDRFLTTLLLKYHPRFKTKYLFRAHAQTVAPDSWKVFMSQRRRWINSTVHNLVELMPLQQLCGFCCFSMRFVVFLDLLSTVVAPVIVVYIGYLIYILAYQQEIVPITAFILLGAIYGLQAIVFILRRKWEMIGWMLIYLIATPVFSFALPLYAFWHMDDFSWGNTRIVTGENGKKAVLSDEGTFDPNSIPKKHWATYQNELLDIRTLPDDRSDVRSEISGVSYGTKHFMGSASVAGSEYGHYPPSRPMSHLDLPRFGNNSRMSLAPSGYGSYDNLEMANLNLPSDDQLLAEIRNILSESDLMTITKKAVKIELEKRFGMDLTLKKQFIGSAVESLIMSGDFR